ncbi:MAG: bifunctional phosphopantothenoylcysteine decarboxylase/phosphopantothenate--cysteine ligase CoaBC [Bacteroidota bacterium]
MLHGKHIVLGVTGGIAAYKSAWLVRELVKAGADVQVVMTRNATQFVTPLTLSTLSRREVIIELFPASGDQSTDQWTKHIDLALWADIMFIAPATANTMAKIVHGMADDFLTTLVLALRCPLALAPAMDVDMYKNDTTQRNIDALRQSGCLVLDPEEGELASGLSGPGRLPEIERLVKFVDGILDKVHQDLKGRKVLVTAGPTHEPIDPVRFIGNRSSGRMGFALANAAAQRGADVTLVSGPVELRTPRNTRRVDVETAEQMKTAVEKEFPSADLVVMSAAVADFTPANVAEKKMKREASAGDTMNLELKKNPDILRGLGEKKLRQVLVGFALETNDGVANAKKKLSSKNLDVVVLNTVGEEGAGFGTETNIVTVITPDGTVERLPKMSKFDVAHEILNRVVPLLK